MRFLVCERQVGQGCDYTIGCGMRFRYVEAADQAALVEKLIWPAGRDEGSTVEGDDRLKDLLIVPAEAVITVDLQPFADAVAAKRRQAKEERIRAAELAKLAELQKKYPTGR